MAATPEARIEAFLADYLARWEEAAPLFEQHTMGAFDQWLPALAGLERRHLLPGTAFRIETSFSRPAPFRPGGEAITRVDVDGDAAALRTAVDDVFDSIREWRLRRVDGEWLIADYETYDADPDLPFVTAEDED